MKWKWGARKNGLAEFMLQPAWQQELIVYVDDDPLRRRQFVDMARKDKFHVLAVDCAAEANTWPAAVFVFDVSALAPLYDKLYWAYSPIATLSEDHPGATMVLLSAMGEKAILELLEEITERTGIRPRYGGTGEWEKLRPVLMEILPEGDGDEQ